MEAFDPFGKNLLLGAPFQLVSDGEDLGLVGGNDGAVSCSYTRASMRCGADGWGRIIYDLGSTYKTTTITLRSRECLYNDCVTPDYAWAKRLNNAAVRFLSDDKSFSQVGIASTGAFGACQKKSWPVSCGPWPSSSSTMSPTLTPSTTPSPTPTAYNSTILCPSSYFCFSGHPVLCPAGSFCPLGSINATLCPKGTFSNAGAANFTLCPPGTFASAIGSTLCQQCPGGHYCPAGTSSWARLHCGLGNYCPYGSGAPTSCPYQVPPTGGWGALQVQGPALGNPPPGTLGGTEFFGTEKVPPHGTS